MQSSHIGYSRPNFPAKAIAWSWLSSSSPMLNGSSWESSTWSAPVLLVSGHFCQSFDYTENLGSDFQAAYFSTTDHQDHHHFVSHWIEFRCCPTSQTHPLLQHPGNFAPSSRYSIAKLAFTKLQLMSAENPSLMKAHATCWHQFYAMKTSRHFGLSVTRLDKNQIWRSSCHISRSCFPRPYRHFTSLVSQSWLYSPAQHWSLYSLRLRYFVRLLCLLALETSCVRFR